MSILLLLSVPMLGNAGTPYQPYDHAEAYNELLGGYTDKRINENTVIVTFRGDRFTSRDTVQYFLLYRAAEVTLNAGYTWFIAAANTTSLTNIKVKEHVSYATDPQRRYPAAVIQQVTYSDDQPVHTKTHPRYLRKEICQFGPHGAVSVIKMFNGPMPANVPNAFDATDVIAHYGPTTF